MKIRRIEPKGISKPIAPYSNALEVTGAKRMIFIAGQVATDARGGILGEGNAEKQAEQIFKKITNLLKQAGASWKNVIRLFVLQTNLADRAAVNKVRAKYVDSARPPASTMAVVTSLALPELLVEVEAIALV